jgi:hypothetical protein
MNERIMWSGPSGLAQEGAMPSWLSLLWALSLIVSAAGCGAGGESKTDASELCGNGVVEEGEDCDEGAARNLEGTGCEPDCTFSCAQDADCDDGESCNGVETCNLALHRCQASLHLEDGTDCSIPTQDSETAPGKCIAGHCGRFCDFENDDCDDENACNGVELCSEEHGVCAPGVPLDCDDGLRCTVDTCDPIEGCENELIDEDGDGFAPSHLACDERGGDCDDDDDTVYPGAPELCDGKDNDCNGEVDEEAPYWYVDCDGDGYPAAGALQSDDRQCQPPPPYNPGSCDHWTSRNPANVANQDCDDLNAMVYPGAVNPEEGSGGFWDRPYCVNTGEQATGTHTSWDCGPATPSFDYDCSGSIERNYPSTALNTGCDKVCVYCYDFCDGPCTGPCNNCLWGCPGPGWVSSVPVCGQTASWRACPCSDSCGLQGCHGCSGTCSVDTTSRQVRCR